MSRASAGPSTRTRQGYHLLHWATADYTYWVVSDWASPSSRTSPDCSGKPTRPPARPNEQRAPPRAQIGFDHQVVEWSRARGRAALNEDEARLDALSLLMKGERLPAATLPYDPSTSRNSF